MTLAKLAVADIVANPDFVTVNKNEVVSINVLANDTGDSELIIGGFSYPKVGELVYSLDGQFVYTPEKDFVGTVLIPWHVSYAVDGISGPKSHLSITFVDPEAVTPDTSEPTPDTAPPGAQASANKLSGEQLNAVSLSAIAALQNHSQAINQFLMLRNSDNRILRNMAY